MIIGAYSVGKVHNMLPWKHFGNLSILCRLGAQYATLFFMIMGAYCIGKAHNMLATLVMGTYCVGKVHNMLPR